MKKMRLFKKRKSMDENENVSTERLVVESETPQQLSEQQQPQQQQPQQAQPQQPQPKKSKSKKTKESHTNNKIDVESNHSRKDSKNKPQSGSHTENDAKDVSKTENNNTNRMTLLELAISMQKN